MKSSKSYSKNVFQHAERRLNKFYNFLFFGGGELTPITPWSMGLAKHIQNDILYRQYISDLSSTSTYNH